jgi:ribose-phosphate pyrophosphokinase
MSTLNLAYPNLSTIKYKVASFPDGQKLITITSEVDVEHGVVIQSRLTWEDLQLIYCATKALREMKVKEIHLYVPYFLGARSDRKFEAGSINYLKEIICPLINSLGFETVTIIDPHSYALEMGLNNFIGIDNSQLVDWALKDIDSENMTICSPDAGAEKKIWKLIDKVQFNGKVITCSKHRDEVSGEICGVTVPIDDFGGKDVVIIDDICDGGRTFLEMAEVIETKNPGKMYLIITHGIFSKGFEELSKHFNKIYCTNSVRDCKTSFVNQFNVF